MLRAFVAGLLISLASMAHAEPVATLSKPSDTLNVVAEAAEMTVFFTPSGGGYTVSMLFTDPDGETMRGRVTLANLQSHEVSFTDEVRRKRSKFRLERAGRLIGVHLIETDLDARMVASNGQIRSNVK
ncbi:MAG: hypothetical protein AAGH68_09005 [Pseudomonadota bacterium]